MVSADANRLRDPQVDSTRTPPQDACFLRRLRLSQMQQDSGALRLQRHVQTLRPRSKTQIVICHKTQMGREQPAIAAFTDFPESCGGAETVGRSDEAEKVKSQYHPQTSYNWSRTICLSHPLQQLVVSTICHLKVTWWSTPSSRIDRTHVWPSAQLLFTVA